MTAELKQVDSRQTALGSHTISLSTYWLRGLRLRSFLYQQG